MIPLAPAVRVLDHIPWTPVGVLIGLFGNKIYI